MIAKMRLNVILDDEASQIAQREMGIHKWNKTQLANGIIKGFDSLKQTVEFIEKEPQMPKSIAWNDLEPCPYRDLEGKKPICRNRKPPANLITSDLRENVCLRCQQLRKQQIETWEEYEQANRVFARLGTKKVSLLIGMKRQLESVEAERDDYKRLHEDGLAQMRRYYETKTDKKDGKIYKLQDERKHLEKENTRLNADLNQKQTRINELEAMLDDPQKLGNLESENKALKTENETFKTTLEETTSALESLREANDEVSKELEIAKNKETMVMCPTRGLQTLQFCQKECPDFITCGRYERIKEKVEVEP